MTASTLGRVPSESTELQELEDRNESFQLVFQEFRPFMGGFAGPVMVGWLAHWTRSVQFSAAAVCAVSVAGAGISMLRRRQQPGGVIPVRSEIGRICLNEWFFMHDSGRL